MAWIPISIQKIKTGDNKQPMVKYLFIVEEGKKNWDLTYQCSREDLLNFRERIDKVLADTSVAEILQVSDNQADVIEKHHKADALCNGCNFKMTRDCITCLFELQSPLERKLFIELKKSYIRFTHQYAINWLGNQISVNDRSYNHPTNNFKEVLTVADFYIEKRGVKLCVYTDGHTFHERTEEQAQRDRNIDRKLQELGYQVLRYTGKDVNENTQKIVEDIKKWTEKRYS